MKQHSASILFLVIVLLLIYLSNSGKLEQLKFLMAERISLPATGSASKVAVPSPGTVVLDPLKNRNPLFGRISIIPIHKSP